MAQREPTSEPPNYSHRSHLRALGHTQQGKHCVLCTYYAPGTVLHAKHSSEECEER